MREKYYYTISGGIKPWHMNFRHYLIPQMH